jgi:hypothetical protein
MRVMESVRPLGLLQIVKESFHLYGKYAGSLLLLSCLIGLPVHLVYLLFFMPIDMSHPLVRIYAGLTAIVFSLVIAVVARTPLVYYVLEIREGHRPRLGESLRSLWMYGGTVLLAGLLSCFFISLGLILLLVPGILLLVWFSLYQPVIVKENLTVTDALKRSKELASGVAGKALGLFFLPALLEIVLRWALVSLISLWRETVLTAVAIDTFLFVLLLPLQAILFTLLYYDARVRSEAYQTTIIRTKAVTR